MLIMIGIELIVRSGAIVISDQYLYFVDLLI